MGEEKRKGKGGVREVGHREKDRRQEVGGHTCCQDSHVQHEQHQDFEFQVHEVQKPKPQLHNWLVEKNDYSFTNTIILLPNKQPKDQHDQDQDFEKRVLRRLKTKTQVLRTTTVEVNAPKCVFGRRGPLPQKLHPALGLRPHILPQAAAAGIVGGSTPLHLDPFSHTLW